MDRYVIAAVIKGEGGEFNANMRNAVFKRFQAKSSTLPAHFTIKAPFETDDIAKVQEILEKFSEMEKAQPLTMEGYDHFDDRVIYMSVTLSKEAKEVHDRLIDELMKVPYIHFKDNEGKNKIFHVTITSKKIRDKFQDIWDYVNEHPYSYEDYFDNITLYKWVPYRWEVCREYLLPRA